MAGGLLVVEVIARLASRIGAGAAWVLVLLLVAVTWGLGIITMTRRLRLTRLAGCWRAVARILTRLTGIRCAWAAPEVATTTATTTAIATTGRAATTAATVSTTTAARATRRL